MTSKLANSEMAEAVDQIVSGFAALRQAGTTPVNSRDAITCVTEFEQLRRLADATAIDLLSSIDAERFHLADGHVSAKVMVRHHARLSNGEASARQQVVNMAATLPDIMDAYRTGTVGSDHVRSIARVHANRRVRPEMIDRQAALLNEAKADFDTFDQRLQQWKRLTDKDGPTPPNQKAHEDRNARIDQDYDLVFHVVASFACQQGLQVNEVFDQYVNAETLADWEKARAEHGNDATSAHLPRTIQQRRADALWQIFIDAAANPNSAVPPDFVHNVVWDADTFEHITSQLLDKHTNNPEEEDDEFELGSNDTPAGDTPLITETTLFERVDPDTMLCHTLDGVPLDPTEMGTNAITAKIRRVVITAAGEKVDLGKARFFTGMARHAIKLKATSCIWPGCNVPTSACQADHLVEHSKDGRTNPGNGAPLCGKHNRRKQAGFTIYRTPDGTWHTIRVDGTEIPNHGADPPLPKQC